MSQLFFFNAHRKRLCWAVDNGVIHNFFLFHFSTIKIKFILLMITKYLFITKYGNVCIL